VPTITGGVIFPPGAQMPCAGYGRDAPPREFQGKHQHYTHSKRLLDPKLNYLQLISQADFVIPVEIDFQWHNIYVIKRPGVEEFLRRMGEIYEVIVFTASVSKVRPRSRPPFSIHNILTKSNVPSTPTPYSTNWTSTRRSLIGYSGRVATFTREIISRYCTFNSQCLVSSSTTSSASYKQSRSLNHPRSKLTRSAY
jgi:hypothetical protein